MAKRGRFRKRGRSRIGGFTRRVSRGGIRRGFGGIMGVAKKGATALGFGLAAGAITQRFAPQFAPVATLAAEFAGGGVTGLVISELLKPFVGVSGGVFSGGLQSIGLFGNMGGGDQPATESL